MGIRKRAEPEPVEERPAWQTGERRRRPDRRGEPAGFWGWIGQAMSQLRDAVQGGAQPPTNGP